MKIRLKRTFQLQVSANKIEVYEPGIHEVSAEIADKMLRFGKAEKVLEKKAPENKVVSAPETKEGDSSSAGAKPRKRGRPRKSD